MPVEPSPTINADGTTVETTGECKQGMNINSKNQWGSMVIASLAWSLKAWMALALPEGGRDAEERRAEKYKLLRMEFTTFRRAAEIDMRLPTIRTIQAANAAPGGQVVRTLVTPNWQYSTLRIRLLKA